MKFPVLALVCLLAFSCNSPSPRSTGNPAYFDVAGYVNGQIQLLANRKPAVTKKAVINQQINNQTTTAIDWAKELELFTQADINKSAFRNSYTTEQPDPLTYQYTLKPTEENLTVRRLTVQLDPATRKPVRLTALLKTENRLYISERHLLLESGTGKNGWSILHYRVEGFQQLTFFERNEFRVDAVVNQ